MTSLEIKLLVSLACVATIYAFVTETRMVNRARKLRDWLQHERPDLWKDINLVARNWGGGQPAWPQTALSAKSYRSATIRSGI